MAGSRTLKLSILADVDDLRKKLDQSSTEVQTFGDKVSKFGKMAGAAFLAAGVAAGAYASKLAIEGVKAAVEDEAAQIKLATSLKNVTGATNATIASTEAYILKTSLASGVTDDQLRPSLDRLVRSTKSVEEAQKLQTLAIDIAAGTGKNLAVVTEALAKAHDGNFTALKKLGGGIDENIIKSKDFNAATAALAETFKNQGSIQAETLQGKMARLKVATDEAKESIGAALLPVIQKISDYLLTTFVPNLQSLINGLTGQGSLSEAAQNSTGEAYKWGEQIKAIIETVIKFKDELKAVAGVIATVFVVSKITVGVTATIALIKTLMTAYNALKASAIVTGVATAFALNPLLGVGAVGLAAGVLAGANALATRSNEAMDLPSIPKAPTPGSELFRSPSTLNLTVNGAIDAEGTARTIVSVLNQSSYRGTLGAGSLVP